MEEVTKALLQYGAIGAILIVVLGLFLWAFKRLFDHVLNQQADFRRFMDETVAALHDMRDEIKHDREVILQRLQDFSERNREGLGSRRAGG